MGQPVKCLLYKHKALGLNFLSIHQNKLKKKNAELLVMMQSRGVGDRWMSGVHLPASLTKQMTFRFPERLCQKMEVYTHTNKYTHTD